jgi:ApaG protein
MNSQLTQGVEVSVETFYQPDYSNPLNREFMFAYRIHIANQNPFPVKLKRRHWFIFDSHGESREVAGDGVVGMMPVIQPNEQYQYVSGCNLNSEMGRMQGSYIMENLHTKKEFTVQIPAFDLVAPCKHN